MRDSATATPVALLAAIGSSLKKNKARQNVVKEAITRQVIVFAICLFRVVSIGSLRSVITPNSWLGTQLIAVKLHYSLLINGHLLAEPKNVHSTYFFCCTSLMCQLPDLLLHSPPLRKWLDQLLCPIP